MTTRISTIGLCLLGTIVTAGQVPGQPAISIREEHGGAYTVAARFDVSEPTAAVRAALTDYEGIPRFMPGVRISRVLERSDTRARVEQEAESKFMFFSKRVHLILDVVEAADVISFRDECGRSFTEYAGAWTMTDNIDRTAITYELKATPAFNVPAFVLRRLLERDARAMVERLQSEIRARAHAR
jgi:hypothetical protein